MRMNNKHARGIHERVFVKGLAAIRSAAALFEGKLTKSLQKE